MLIFKYALCSSALNIYKSNFSMFLNDIKSCFFVEINEFTEMEFVRKELRNLLLRKAYLKM